MNMNMYIHPYLSFSLSLSLHIYIYIYEIYIGWEGCDQCLQRKLLLRGRGMCGKVGFESSSESGKGEQFLLRAKGVCMSVPRQLHEGTLGGKQAHPKPLASSAFWRISRGFP